jgi:hypothetical protein
MPQNQDLLLYIQTSYTPEERDFMIQIFYKETPEKFFNFLNI